MRLIISLSPDLRDTFGHWFAFEKALAGLEVNRHTCLANIDCNIGTDDFDILPFFDNSTYRFHRTYKAEKKHRFSERIRSVLESYLRNRGNISHLHFVMYTGDVTYIDALEPFFEKFDGRASLTINLFYSHFDYAFESSEFVCNQGFYQKILDVDYLKSRKWLDIRVDSGRMVDIVRDIFGVRIGLWPMINLDIDSSCRYDRDSSPVMAGKRIVFPGNGQFTKGFDLACGFVEKFGQRLNRRYGCKFILRDQFRDSPDNNRTLRESLKIISDRPWVEIVSGILDRHEFLDLFFRADCIMLPYRKKNFYTRTSACLVNAVLSGADVLVTEDTWMASELDYLASGSSFADGNIDSMYQTLCIRLEEAGCSRSSRQAEIRYRKEQLYDIF